jgi:hypothetical protein
MIKMENFMKMNNRIVVILSLGFIFSSVSIAKESLPLIDQKQKRLKNETRIFNQSTNYKKNSVFAQKDTFIDNNKDGINDLLSKEKDLSPLFQFLNNKVSNSLSKDKSNSAKEPVGIISVPKSNTKSISGEQISDGASRLGGEKIRYPKRPEKPIMKKTVLVKPRTK